MPDIGIFDNRYRFELTGNRQKARIVAWAPMPRLEKATRFKWDPDVWYTVKLRVDVAGAGTAGAKATVKAKAWKRGTDEPSDWLLQVVDSNPNTQGAPGLYGYSAGSTDKKNGAEIFYDNILVSPNS